jgi:hypothetical protein
MTKYVARVTQVLHPAIHTIGSIKDGKVRSVADLPLPNRIEIELKSGRKEPCMMYRYTDAGKFCGDTWHKNLDAAFDQATFEYGLTEADFSRIDAIDRMSVQHAAAAARGC